MIGVEQWAEIRPYFVEKRSKRAIHRLTGVHRDTITRALISDQPPRHQRASTGSKLDPFKERDLRAAHGLPAIQSLRLRIWPPSSATKVASRSSMTMSGRCSGAVPGAADVSADDLSAGGVGAVRSVGAAGADSGWSYGQQRRGSLAVTAELCWSRLIAGAVVFEEAPDILGLGRCLGRIGAPPEKAGCGTARARSLVTAARPLSLSRSWAARCWLDHPGGG